ncbi:MAG TPA: BtrH N-terminal domain-containing protein [Candidatus Methanoperedenaceae archaeon]|nr:BtrH N-terminal domain-containing protein [Candidatus Methanoperedenaceae archaeon]
MIIDNFKHYPGVHCESTSMRDLLAYNGLRLSEPMVFGLGCGLGFIYWDMKKMPFPFVGGRIKPGELSKNISDNIGFKLTVEETRSSGKAWITLKENLLQNCPVGLKGDMFYLDYLDHPSHFAAHYIVACGFDDHDVFVADTDFRVIQKVSIGNLQLARSARGLFSSGNLSFRVDNAPERVDLAHCIRNAFRETGYAMLNPPIKNFGISGMRKFSREILDWHKRSNNPQRDFESHYVMFEKAGTGGAGFRNLFYGFLKESLHYLKDSRVEKACDIYSEIAPVWTKISDKIREAPESKNIGAELEEISGMIKLQADREEEAMKCLVGV